MFTLKGQQYTTILSHISFIGFIHNMAANNSISISPKTNISLKLGIKIRDAYLIQVLIKKNHLFSFIAGRLVLKSGSDINLSCSSYLIHRRQIHLDSFFFHHQNRLKLSLKPLPDCTIMEP